MGIQGMRILENPRNIMPFFNIFNSCQSNNNRNETRTCTDNVTQICSGSNFLSCCNNLRQTINNVLNPAPSSDEDDSDSTSGISQGDQPLHESDSTREIVQNGIHSSFPSRNKIMVRVTPNIDDSNKNGACLYEYWSGIYAYKGDVNGKSSYQHTSGDFLVWFHDVQRCWYLNSTRYLMERKNKHCLYVMVEDPKTEITDLPRRWIESIENKRPSTTVQVEIKAVQ